MQTPECAEPTTGKDPCKWREEGRIFDPTKGNELEGQSQWNKEGGQRKGQQLNRLRSGVV